MSSPRFHKTSIQALGMSAGVHALLAAAIFFGVNFRSPSEPRGLVEVSAVSARGPKNRVRADKQARTSEATSQNSAARDETSSPAAVLGDGPAGVYEAALSGYLSALRSQVESRVHYPLALRRRGVAGRVGLTITVRNDGSLEDVAIEKSSGSPELDALASDAVRESSPFSPFTDDLKNRDRLTLSLPIDFRII